MKSKDFSSVKPKLHNSIIGVTKKFTMRDSVHTLNLNRQFSTSSVMRIDSDPDEQSLDTKIEDAKIKLNEIRERLDKLEEIRFSSRIDKDQLEKAKHISDYIQLQNEVLFYYIEKEMPHTSQETWDLVNRKLGHIRMDRRISEDIAFDIHFNPKDNVYPDRESLAVLNNLNKLTREKLMYCRDKVYGTTDDPVESTNVLREINKRAFIALERNRDYYLNENALTWMREDSKRIAFYGTEEEYDEKQIKFEDGRGILSKLQEQRGDKKVRFVDDVPSSDSSSSITPVGNQSPPTRTASAPPVLPSETVSFTPDDLPSRSASAPPVLTSNSLNIKDKGKAKESLIDDYANPLLEQPSYMDPED